MKINIIMPTYNDSKTIIETLQSIVSQTYQEWHLTIVNDGSVDETEQIIKKYIEENTLQNKTTYLYQKNSDQLNAIKTGLNSIENEDSLIYILHSDDLLNDNYVLEKANKYFMNNKNVDAIISDYNLIDKDSNIIGYQKVKKYYKKKSTVALQGLWLGRNLFVDVAFFKYNVYKKYVFENYLTWNKPFWLITNPKIDMLNVKNVDFPFFKYRVFEENYINNEIGLLNVLNGELRTALNIFNNINIPLYKYQYLLFRIFNKLHLPYKTFYTNKRSTKIYEKIKFIINKRINDNDLKKYVYFSSILDFFRNYNERKIKVNNIKKTDVFFGADVRTFNKKMLSNNLPEIYNKIFKEMKKGFSIIETDKKSYNKLVNILKFLDIFEYVDVKIKD